MTTEKRQTTEVQNLFCFEEISISLFISFSLVTANLMFFKRLFSSVAEWQTHLSFVTRGYTR